MKDTLEKITDKTSDIISDISEIAKERIFTPMYFYFLCAWVITNWKFVYTLIFVDEKIILETQGVLKVDYLYQMYSFFGWYSILHLIIIPAVASFVVVWWLSIFSEKFYEKHKKHQMNKRIIKNKIEYEERVEYAFSQRKIRDAKSDENSVKYLDNENRNFNNWYDDGKENIKVGEYEFLPSEALYNNDYEAYRVELEEFNKTRPDINF